MTSSGKLWVGRGTLPLLVVYAGQAGGWGYLEMVGRCCRHQADKSCAQTMGGD